MNSLGRPVFALVLAVLAVSAPSHRASAQAFNALNAGTYQSPKGFGLSLQVQNDSVSFDALTVVADLRGVIAKGYSTPGIKCTYTRDIIIKHIDREGCGIDFYAGPGLTAGYVHDGGEPFCFIAGMSGVAGGRFSFDRNFTINLELGGDIALKAGKDYRFNRLKINDYRSGFYYILCPQLLIHWRF